MNYPHRAGCDEQMCSLLGTLPACQVMVRNLPWNCPGEQLQAYIHEMLHDDDVKVTEWRSITFPLIISATWRFFNELLDLSNWGQHLEVKQFYSCESAVIVSSSSDDDER